jgi:RNA recognition motif-containing protein
VGNLPPGTHIIDLKDHFSRQATHDIESVFLISKSNCAFVNYKNESSCAAAMSRFHDSRFQGVRLVCRLRRGSAPSASAVQPFSTTAPSPSSTFPQATSATSEVNLKVEGAAKSEEAESAAQDLLGPETESQAIEKVKEKFFVVKSLTIEDLERSVQTGVWATQAHNEDALNKAYQASPHTLALSLNPTLLIPHLDSRECLLDLLREQVRGIFWIRSNGLSHRR